MKKPIFITVSLAIAAVAFFAYRPFEDVAISGNDLLLQQRDSANAVTWTRNLAFPGSTSIVAMNTSSKLPEYFSAGTGMGFNNTSRQVYVKNVPVDSIAGLATVAKSGSYNDLSNKPSSAKRIDLFSGSTNSSGIYTGTFSPSFSGTPYINAEIINPGTNQYSRVTAVSSTGFTVHVFQRNSINLLSTDLLLSTTVNVNGASVQVSAIEP